MNQCRTCKKPINNNKILCQECRQRIRNTRHVFKWVEKLLGYPEDLEVETESVVIAS